MTQVRSAQSERDQFAWKAPADARTLAQRRAGFAAQMRDMALADLTAVADRLKLLHKRLEEKTGRRWPQQEIAQKAGVAYRTFQTWEGGKNENQDGLGYAALARFYRRQLGDKAITRNWIVFGQEEAPEDKPVETPPRADPYAEQLDRIEKTVKEILKRLGGEGEEASPAESDDAPAVPVRLPPDPDPQPDVPSDDAQDSETG